MFELLTKLIVFFLNFLVEVDLDDVRKEWVSSTGQLHIKNIAEHYGVYEHLFGYAYFYPRIPLNIKVSSLRSNN